MSAENERKRTKLNLLWCTYSTQNWENNRRDKQQEESVNTFCFKRQLNLHSFHLQPREEWSEQYYTILNLSYHLYTIISIITGYWPQPSPVISLLTYTTLNSASIFFFSSSLPAEIQEWNTGSKYR